MGLSLSPGLSLREAAFFKTAVPKNCRTQEELSF
jgi:hypothetical protein